MGGAGRRCTAIVRELDIPEPFDLSQFMAKLVFQRKRLVFLHPFTAGPGVPCGVWIATDEADYIFHEEGTIPSTRPTSSCTRSRICCWTTEAAAPGRISRACWHRTWTRGLPG